jgi:uncharacterized membrane protein
LARVRACPHLAMFCVGVTVVVMTWSHMLLWLHDAFHLHTIKYVAGVKIKPKIAPSQGCRPS